MIYKSSISIEDKEKKIYDIFKNLGEEQDRSIVEYEHDGENLLILVSATDSVALRASLNGVTKLLTVYENMSKI